MLDLKRALHPLGLLSIVLAVVALAIPDHGLAMPMPGDGPPTAMDVSSSTGDATMSIPIPVPPGTGGFAPQLALTYSSSGGDGPFGVGWSLEFGEIRRSIRFGIPSFDDTLDRFELGGELLVVNPAESTGTQTRYHTSTETFARIHHVKGPFIDYWELTRPDGVKLRYGQTDASRVKKDGFFMFRWLLDEMVDPFGNTIKFSYRLEGGEAYPERVQYTFRNGSPVGTLRTVEFLYETRPDPSLTFMGSVGRQITLRADRIEVKTGSTIFRKVELTYAGQPGVSKVYPTGRSRLVSSQLFGVGGTAALPPQGFEYSDPTAALGAGPDANWETSSVSLPPGLELSGPNGEDRGVRFAEINGDGRLDLVRGHEAQNGALTRQVYLNTGSGWVLDAGWTAALALDAAYLQTAGRKLQYSHTGVGVVGSTVQVLPYPNQVRFGSEVSRYAPGPPANPSLYGVQYRPPPTWRLVDVNGDGRADLVSSLEIAQIGGYSGIFGTQFAFIRAGEIRSEVWINTGSGWSRDTQLSATLPPLFKIFVEFDNEFEDQTYGNVQEDSYEATFGDVDGDSIPDLVVVQVDFRQVALDPFVDPFYGVIELDPIVVAFRQNESGWSPIPEYSLTADQLEYSPFAHSAGTSTITGHHSTTDSGIRPLDLNADGLIDLVTGAGQRVLFNRGTGWCDSQQDATCLSEEQRFAPPFPVATYMIFADLNGDRLVDAMRSFAPLRAWIQDPKGPSGNVWVEDARFAPPLPAQVYDATISALRPTGTQVVDVDFDGDLDFVERTGAARRGRARFGDLLARLESGRGGIVEYEYESASKQQNFLYNFALDGVINDAEGLLNWTTRAVVSSRRMSGIEVDPVSETFLYGQPRFDPLERMSLGFAGTRNVAADQVVRDRFYEQRRGLAGTIRRDVVGTPFGERSRTTNTYELLAGSDPAVGQGSTAAAKVGRLVGSTSYRAYGVSAFFGGSGETIGSAIVKSFEYDPKNGDPHGGFNFITRTTTARRTGTVVETRRMRAPDSPRWIVGLPERMLITGAEGELSKMEVGYRDEGRPDQIKRYEGPRGNLGSAVARITTMSYDVFGNVNSMTDPANRTTAFGFDGDSSFPGGGSFASPTGEATHSVMVAVRDPLQEVTTFKPDATTGLITETLKVYSGDREKAEFDGFGRLKRELFQASGQSEVVLSESDYFDLNGESGAPQEHVINRLRLYGSGTESLRAAVYLDGFGQEVRRIEEAPRVNGQSRYFGVSTRRNMATLQITTTLPASCGADPHCLALAGGSQPREVVSTDALGRAIVMQTPAGFSKFDYRSVIRSHPDTGSQSFDAVLAMDPRGYLTQRIFDGDDLVWVEECGNPAIGVPETADLTNVQCENTGPNAAVTFYRYERTGEVREVYDALAASNTNPAQASLRYVNDSLGRVREIHDINRTGPILKAYNAAGEVDQETNARGQVITSGHDGLGRLTTMSYSIGGGVTQEYSIGYDSRTRLAELIQQKNISPGGTSTIFSQEFDHDPLGRVIRNRLQYGSNATLVTERDFDLRGRTTRIRYPDLNTEVAYEYEGGYLRRVCELAGASSCTGGGAIPYISNVDYDGIGREAGVTGFAPADNSYAPPVMSFTYNSNTYELDSLRVSNVFEGIGAETLDLIYGRDPAGNVTSITDNSPVFDGANDIPLGAAYTYDGRSRVASWTRGSQTKYFTYNTVGNLTGKQVNSPGAENQVYDATRRHRLIQAGGMTYGYDPDGNVTQRGAQQLTYDALSRTTCIGTSGSCQPFTYGLDGLRIAAGGGSTPLRIFVEDLFEWQPATGKATARIVALGRQVATKTIGTTTLRTGIAIHGIPVERIVPFVLGAVLALGLAALLTVLIRWGLAEGLRLRPMYGAAALGLAFLLVAPPRAWAGFSNPPTEATYRRWVWQDPLGTSVYITDEAGLAVHQRAFEPFGGIAAERGTPPEATERTFAGHQFEDGTGLYYMKARWYDPVAGRFLSTDPIARDLTVPQSMNAYSYVENRPTMRIDPKGTDAVSPDRKDKIEEITIVGKRPDSRSNARPIRLEGFGAGGGFSFPNIDERTVPDSAGRKAIGERAVSDVLSALQRERVSLPSIDFKVDPIFKLIAGPNEEVTDKYDDVAKGVAEEGKTVRSGFERTTDGKAKIDVFGFAATGGEVTIPTPDGPVTKTFTPLEFARFIVLHEIAHAIELQNRIDSGMQGNLGPVDELAANQFALNFLEIAVFPK